MVKQKRLFSIIGKVLIVVFLIIEIYPIFWILVSSLKSTQEFNLTASYSLPRTLVFDNYIEAWNRGKMNIYFKNSAIVVFVSLFFIVILSVTSAFALTKMKWKLRNLTLNIFLSGIMVPTAVVLIPLYTMYNLSGLINTRLSLIITYIAFGLPLSIFLLKGYMTALQDEILEAAVIDGASIYQILYRIVFPLMKTGIVTVSVIQFMFLWNDLMFTMTFISDTSLKTVQTGLLYFSDQYGNRDWGAIFASIAIAVMPTLIIYVALNKMVIEGMSSGAVKG